ncbi:hypothetical protein EYF80_061843 [Liparis tanakae]|uniref:Uncharacterized protein n=1 Tax=Liparis tanakae TaxID=230148 RepID=A0A4Z2EGV7_9TELE|nr:hypothetical protein EYF80_061843 [Liparis tanakae]
MDSVSAVAP